VEPYIRVLATKERPKVGENANMIKSKYKIIGLREFLAVELASI
jgi:hypothetical protein